jgi:hypothetical protein
MTYHYTRAVALTATLVLFGTSAFGHPGPRQSSSLLSMAFGPQHGAPMPESTVVVGATNPPAAFPEECRPVSYVTFSFLALDCLPGELRLCLNCRSGRQWYRTLPLPSVGIWKQYIVAVNYVRGWTIGPWKTEALFQSDSAGILSAGLTVNRGGSTAAQQYLAADFTMEGAGWGTADTDGDRACNAAEAAAGTDPFDRADVLALSASQSTDSGPGFGVAWYSVEDRLYTLWRGTNLLQPWVSQQTAIPARVPVNVYWDAGATGAGPYYYGITVDNPVP